MDLEHIDCDLCSGNDYSVVFRRKDYAYRVSDCDFAIVRCRNCGLVYVNPRPSASDIQSFYPPEFYGVGLTAEELLRSKQEQLDLKYDYVKDLPPGKLLDIGCQKGEFMYFMRQRGWDVRGMDFSATPPNLFDLDIFHGDLDSASYPHESFDLVTLWAVLEHVYGPRSFLKAVNRLLKPGGKAVILVTNFRSFQARFMQHDDVPRHTTLFTKRTLKSMLNTAGFCCESFHFNCDLFGGHSRGILNFLVKLAAGESIGEIVYQNRALGHWNEFSSCLRGVYSTRMLKVDSFDIAFTPHLDKWLDRLHLGFIMIAKATKR